jgi:hypothetical protein
LALSEDHLQYTVPSRFVLLRLSEWAALLAGNHASGYAWITCYTLDTHVWGAVNGEQPQAQSWWKTLPGVLTAIAGILTATTGLLVVLNQMGILPGKPSPFAGQRQGVVVSPPPPADICTRLEGRSLELNANEHQGVIGPIHLSREIGGGYKFDTSARFTSEPTDPVSGTCRNGAIDFVRTRQTEFTQRYVGSINGDGATGHFSHNSPAPTWAWSGRIVAP